MAIAEPPPLTVEEFLALPETGTDRELISGQLRERPMTVRNRHHSRIVTRISRLLDVWLDDQPDPRGQIVSGEAGFRLAPDSLVGIDVAYVSAEVVAQTPASASVFLGPPVLAVEVLSPSDKQEEITEKIDLYLKTGVALVWVVDPKFRTLSVFRPDAEPELFNVTQGLAAEPHLPGFQVAVARIFET